jgi:hypothetical protein
MSYTYTWSQPDAFVTHAYTSPSHAPSNVFRSNENYHHQAAIPVSSYSSLAGALDADAITTRPRSHVCPSHKVYALPCADLPQSIYKSKASTNSSYPYPVSHHDPPQQSRSRSNSYLGHYREREVASPSRSSKNSKQNQYYREEPVPPAPLTRMPREPKPSGPTNHALVPQQEFREPLSARPYTDPYFRHPPITFQTANIPELGVRVGKVTERYSPSVNGGRDPVLAGVGEKEIRFWILVSHYLV